MNKNPEREEQLKGIKVWQNGLLALRDFTGKRKNLVVVTMIVLLSGSVLFDLSHRLNQKSAHVAADEQTQGERNNSTILRSNGAGDGTSKMEYYEPVINLADLKDPAWPDNLKAVASPPYLPKTDYGTILNREAMDEGLVRSLDQFAAASSSLLFSEGDSGKNFLYSPISLYMALALTAESADSSIQREILDALGLKNFDQSKLNRQVNLLFKRLYFDNQYGKLKLANSLWLDQKVPFKKDFLEKVAADYYATSFSVDFSNQEESARQINQWIAYNTGNKLGTNQGKLEIPAGTIMSLINTVYFLDEWTIEFKGEETKKGPFYPEQGDAVSCDFMNAVLNAGFTTGNGYTAAGLEFRNGGKMIFILPNQGQTVESIMANPENLRAVISGQESKFRQITFSIPKFSFYHQAELNSVVKKLGVNKAFEANLAGFTPLTDVKPLSLTKIIQSACISIDEKGCEAAAYTAMLMTGGDVPQEKGVMKLDRPFIFMITSREGTPLFVGAVNNPLSK